MGDGQPAVAADFGRVLRDKREALSISQENLAGRAGLHRTYVSLLERGQRTASLEVVRKLAAGLETTMTDLIAGTEGR